MTVFPIFQAPLSARESTNERESSELVRIQTHLERTVQEKRALEMLAQQLRKQLIQVTKLISTLKNVRLKFQERQSHDNTKREMERLKKLYEKK